jgi:hypothetical protein
MIENEFRRIALAQGLLPMVPPSPPWDASDPVQDRGAGRSPATVGPADNPAMVEQHAPDA